MSRQRAICPKIAGCVNDADTKNKLPKAIDHNAGGQWILFARNPAGKLDPSLLLDLVKLHRQGT